MNNISNPFPQAGRLRQLRIVRLARGLRGFAGGDFLGAFLQMLHQAGGDVAAGDDPHEFAGAVQHGKTAEAVPVELRHRAHEGKMIAQRDEVPRHPPRRRFVDMALVEGVDDVFDADQSHRDAVLEDGHARDAVGFHQMLEGAQRIARSGGHGRPGHGIAHAQFVNQDLGNGNFERLARGHAGFGWGSVRHGHGDRAVIQPDRRRIMRHRSAGGQFRTRLRKDGCPPDSRVFLDGGDHDNQAYTDVHQIFAGANANGSAKIGKLSPCFARRRIVRQFFHAPLSAKLNPPPPQTRPGGERESAAARELRPV